MPPGVSQPRPDAFLCARDTSFVCPPPLPPPILRRAHPLGVVRCVDVACDTWHSVMPFKAIRACGRRVSGEGRGGVWRIDSRDAVTANRCHGVTVLPQTEYGGKGGCQGGPPNPTVMNIVKTK